MRKHHKTDIFGMWGGGGVQVGGKMGLGQQERMTGLGSFNSVLFLRCSNRKTYFREESAKQSADVV